MKGMKKTPIARLVAGAGGGKAQTSSRTPVEANDTVNSRAMMSILDLLGEGVIGGLKDGAKSIFLNDLPLQNDDGSYNFSGLSWWQREGTQDQSIIEGFDVTETPKSIARTVKSNSPVTLAVDNDSADSFRVILKFSALKTVDKTTGDTTGATVSYLFEVSSNGGKFIGVTPDGESSSTVTLTAKKSGAYYRSYSLKLPKPGAQYQVRVSRITPDSTDSYVLNDFSVDTVGEVVNTNMNYPNSALVGLKVNSEQFGSSMPTRSYLISGMKIQVPSNYNPVDGSYSGVWDGTFNLASSSNPAWILYDLLTNARYGLGEFVKPSMIDIGQLYQIGRYCDAQVDDGFGGKEKRFAINTQITSRQDAYRVIQDIAGAFRGMVFWSGGGIHVTQDSPSDPVAIFSTANVVDGKFTYKGSARKDRPSVAMISYNNKEDHYKQNIEYVEDEESVKRYGIRKTESVAFGCTSRGMAHRVGLWTLYTARMESDVISFTAGMDAAFLTPGDTILIQDKYRSGRRNSGRIKSASANSITLDAPIDMTHAGSITFHNQEGKLVSRDIQQSGTGIQIVTFKDALSDADMPVTDGVWGITQDDLVPMQARVVGVSQGDDGQSFAITCVQNNPTKYAAIDDGAQLTPQNTTILDPTFSTPENLTITESTYLSSPGNLSVKLTATWTGKSAEYWVSYRRSDAGNVGNWVSVKVNEEQFELLPVAENGQYDFQVYGVSFSGRKTKILSTTYKVLGTLTPPQVPTSLTAVGDYRQILLSWVNPSSVDLDHIEIFASKTNDVSKATLLATSTTTNFTHAGLEDSVTWFYWVRAANKRGMVSGWNSSLGTSATTKDVLSFLNNKITSSQLGKDLLSTIDSKAVGTQVDKSIQDAKTQAQAAVDQAKTDATNQVSAAKDALNKTIQQEVTDRANALATESKNRAQAISDAVTVEAQARSKEIADNVKTLTSSITKEVSDRTSAIISLDTKTGNAISKEASDRANAVSAEASARADAVLQEKNARVADISTVQTQIQTATTSLAQQISQVAAGTGEQFDSLKIWFFDNNDAAGWTSRGGAVSLSADGWMKPATNTDPYIVSPAGLAVASLSYRFVKIRLRKTGSPKWQGEFRWKAAGASFDNTSIVKFKEPLWDENNVATIAIEDIPWTGTASIDQIRLDLSESSTDANFIEVDWLAVGRPTPGAGMADVLNEQKARVDADAAEATQRQTLASQMRGAYDGNDLSKVSSGLIYQEQQARVSADQAEATARQSLQTKVDNNIADVTKSLDTLTANDKSQASDITSIKTSLGNKAEASALQALNTTVTQQGANISSQSQSITKLQNDLGAANTNIGTKADQTALTAVQGSVTQQGRDIAAANSNISNLQSSLKTTNDNVAKKADSSTVNDLTTKVSSQGDSLNSQSNRVTALENGITAGDNIVPNSQMLNNAQGWVGNAVVIDGYQGVTASSGWAPNSPRFGVTAGETLDLNLMCQSSAAVNNLSFGFRFDGPGLNNLTQYAQPTNYAAGDKKNVAASFVVPNGATTALLQPNQSANVPISIYNVVATRRNAGTVANGKAISDLTNTVTQQGNDLSSTSANVTNLQNSLNTTNANVAKKADSSALQSLQNTVTQQGGQITTQSGNIVSLQNSVSQMGDNMDNMMINPSFENDLFMWSVDNASAVSVATSGAALGNKCLQIGSAKVTSGVSQQVARLKAGRTYQITCQYKFSSDAVIADGSNTKIRIGNTSGLLRDSQFGLSTSWTTATLTYVVVADQVNVNVGFRGLLSAGSLFIDDIIMADITDAVTGAANTSAITDLQSKVTQQGNSLTSQGSQITNLQNGLNTTNANVSKKADGSVLDALSNKVSAQNDALTAQNSRVSNLESNITVGENLIPNPSMLNNAQGWGNGVKSVSKIDNVAAAVCSGVWSPFSGLVAVKPGETIYWSFDIQAISDLKSKDFSIYYTDTSGNFSNTNNWFYYKDLPQGQRDHIQVAFTVPDGMSFAYLNGGKNDGTFYLWNVTATRQTTADKVNASAISDLNTTVTQQGNNITSQSNALTNLQNGLNSTNSILGGKADATAVAALQNTVNQQGSALNVSNSNITSLQASLNRRTVFTVLAGGMGSSVAGGVYDESGKRLGSAGRSYALFVFSKNADGSTSVTSSKTYDVYANASNGATLTADVAALANGTYAAIVTGDEPRQNKETVYSAIESLGGTDEMLSTLPYRGAYILLGRKGMKSGDGLELMSPTGGGSDSNITTSVEFINGVMSGLGSAGGVMIKSNANASAISSLQNTVTQQGANITSQGSQITNLQNGLNTTNANVSKKADSSALDSLNSKVSSQSDSLTAQNSRVSSLESRVTGGENLIPNPMMLNNAQGWGGSVKSVSTIDSLPAAVCSGAWMPYSGAFPVKAGETIYWSFDIQAIDDLKSKDFSIYYYDKTGKTSSINNWFYYKDLAKGQRDHLEVSFVVPDGMVLAYLSGGKVDSAFYLWNVSATRQTAADRVNASAITDLSTTVSQQGSNISSQSNAITALQNNLNTTNDNIGKKADSSALDSLKTTVSQQSGLVTSQGNRVSALENNMTLGDNIVPNSAMLNNAQGWSGNAVTVDGYSGVKSSSGWTPNSPKFPVTPGDVLDLSLMCQTDAAINGLGWGIRFDGPNLNNLTTSVGVLNYSAGEKKSVVGTITVPAGATTGFIQPNMSPSIGVTIYNVEVTRRDAGTVINSLAITNLSNTVTQQGNSLSAANNSITNLSSSLSQARKQGANMVIDGSFESTNLSGNMAVYTNDNHSGNRCAKFTRTAPTNSGGNNDVRYGEWFDLRANQVVYVEVWAKLDPTCTVDSSNGWANVGMWWQNSSEANNWPSAFQIKFSNLTTTWQKFSGYVRVGTDAYRGAFWMAIPQNASNIQGYSFLVDDVVIMDATEGYNAQQTANAASDAVNSLSTKVSSIDGKVTAQASQLASLQSNVDSSSSKLDTLSKTISDSQSTQASLNTSLQSQISNQASANIKNQTDLNTATTNIASIKSTQSTQASQISSIAQSQTDMKATMNNQSSSIQTLQTAVASNSGLSSTWMVKMETNNAGQKYAAGIALGIDGKNQQSQFLVQADRFALLNTGNGNTTTPFVIDNGVTYMNSAYIKDGSIGSAKVGDLMSNGFQENVRGWRISRDGTMNINGSAGGTGRMVISNNRIDVYDDNNVLRVRLGLL